MRQRKWSNVIYSPLAYIPSDIISLLTITKRQFMNEMSKLTQRGYAYSRPNVCAG